MTTQQKNTIRRINRILRPSGHLVKVPRGIRAATDQGEFYLVDAGRNLLLRSDVDLEDLQGELRN